MSTESTGDDLAADRRQALLDRLSALGECEHDAKWLDYSAAGIRPSDIRSLIEIALMYTPGGDFGDERLIWAPVHAMRALGQLHAAEAIGPLTALFRWVDDDNDDWLIEDLSEVYAMFGPPAIPTLSAYLHDARNPLYARSTAADGLQLIGTDNPSRRDEVVAILSDQLAKFADNDPELNGFLIGRLMALKAIEATSVIEQAFAADSVETFITGDWEDVQVEMGLKAARETPRPFYAPRGTDDVSSAFGILPGLEEEPVSTPEVVQTDPNSRQARRKAEREAAKKKKSDGADRSDGSDK